MKKIDELNKRKVPVVRIDNSLEKFKDQPLFQEKADKANEILKNIGLPKVKNTTADKAENVAFATPPPPCSADRR